VIGSLYKHRRVILVHVQRHSARSAVQVHVISY